MNLKCGWSVEPLQIALRPQKKPFSFITHGSNGGRLQTAAFHPGPPPTIRTAILEMNIQTFKRFG
jgi:hypothetical protein